MALSLRYLVGQRYPIALTLTQANFRTSTLGTNGEIQWFSYSANGMCNPPGLFIAQLWVLLMAVAVALGLLVQVFLQGLLQVDARLVG